MGKIFSLSSNGINLAAGRYVKNSSSLIIADNVHIDAPGVIRSRPGWKRYNSQSVAGSIVYNLVAHQSFGDKLLMFALNGVYSAQLATSGVDGVLTPVAVAKQTGFVVVGSPNYSYESVAVFFGIPIFTSVGSGIVTRMNGAFYSATNKLIPLGIPQPIAKNQSYRTVLTTPASGNWMVDDDCVIYRVVCKYKVGTRYVYSAPSEKITIKKVAATGGFAAATTQTPTIRWSMPTLDGVAVADLTTDTVYFQIYRSKKVTLTATVTDAKDELQLVYESTFTAAAVAAGSGGGTEYSFTDTTPDEALGIFEAPFLYTNAENGEESPFEGLLKSNSLPPSASDLAFFKDCLWLGNITDVSRFEIKLLTTSLISAGNTIVITPSYNSTPYTITCVAAIAAAAEFTVVTGGTVSSNIEATSYNICHAINSAQGFVTARYIAGAYGAPGSIRLESTMHGYTFLVAATGGLGSSCIQPYIGVAIRSDAVAQTNTLAYSKPLRPDAFPAVQQLSVGAPGTTIIKLLPFRDVMLVFTTQGLFVVRGQDVYSFSVDSHTTWLRLVNKRSVCVCDDAVYAWTHQGLVKINESGATIISGPILPLIEELISVFYSTANQGSGTADAMSGFYQYVFVVANDAQHKVYFWYPSTTSLYGADLAFVFDTRLGVWTTVSCAGTNTYHCGVEATANRRLCFGAYDGFVYSERLGLAETDFIDHNQSGADTAISKSVKWTAQIDEPGALKSFRELLLFWHQHAYISALGPPASSFVVNFSTDFSAVSETETISAPTTAITRTYVPSSAQRATIMNILLIHEASEYFAIEGTGLVFENFDGRPTK